MENLKLVKVCARCKVEKNVIEFSKHSANKDGLYSYCQDCKRERDRERYAGNTPKLLLKAKQYAENNKEKIKEYITQYREDNLERLRDKAFKYRRDHPCTAIYHGAKSRAKKNKLPFNLDIEDIDIPDYCPILGLKLEVAEGKVSSGSPSLDRINCSEGYTKGNVQVISYKANTMKSDANVEELLSFATWVFKTYGEKNVEKNCTD